MQKIIYNGRTYYVRKWDNKKDTIDVLDMIHAEETRKRRAKEREKKQREWDEFYKTPEGQERLEQQGIFKQQQESENEYIKRLRDVADNICRDITKDVIACRGLTQYEFGLLLKNNRDRIKAAAEANDTKLLRMRSMENPGNLPAKESIALVEAFEGNDDEKLNKAISDIEKWLENYKALSLNTVYTYIHNCFDKKVDEMVKAAKTASEKARIRKEFRTLTESLVWEVSDGTSGPGINRFMDILKSMSRNRKQRTEYGHVLGLQDAFNKKKLNVIEVCDVLDNLCKDARSVNKPTKNCLKDKDSERLFKKYQPQLEDLKEAANKITIKRSDSNPLPIYGKCMIEIVKTEPSFLNYIDDTDFLKNYVLPIDAFKRMQPEENFKKVQDKYEKLGLFKSNDFVSRNIKFFPDYISRIPSTGEHFKDLMQCIISDPSCVTKMTQSQRAMMLDYNRVYGALLETFANCPDIMPYLTEKEIRILFRERPRKVGAYILKNPQILEKIPDKMFATYGCKYMFNAGKETIRQTLGDYVKYSPTLMDFLKIKENKPEFGKNDDGSDLSN